MRWIVAIQGVYFAATGLWPLAHLPSFLAVTGDKHDKWLVRTLGALIAVVGAVLVLAAARDAVSAEVAVLAIGSALALGAVDVVYVARGVIPRVYLLDAAAEALWVTGWAAARLAG